ncbi:hypothetical protein [Oribacterium sp. WCC10]|uniref:hypothetical protein n=1 Tax=Oribacterium sp. WCC10 TaxID=1855343 RepID=UPI0008EA5C03|nr:hypothetical protein [Oribacterium sp. WCC10]SFG45843.1 hypothetical protein SAMN05216356_10982 [Oribacterium sp. WCC10]
MKRISGKEQVSGVIRGVLPLLIFTFLVFNLSGCDHNENISGKDEGHGRIEAKGDGKGVKLSASEETLAEEFSSKLKTIPGMGEFELSAEKIRGSSNDFVLRVKNRNSFPAGAFILCVFRDSEGNALAAVSRETEILMEGAEDILGFSFEDDALKDSYENLEITAYAREKSHNTVMMIDNFPSSKIKLYSGEPEKGGMYDGWQKVDVKVGATDTDIGDVHSFFYDVDDHLIYYSPVWTRENEFSAYCPENFDHCEILIEKLVDGAVNLPDSVYDSYKSEGCITNCDGSEVYESPEGKVQYDFFKAADGTILLHAVNISNENVDWNINSAIIFSGSRNNSVYDLFLEPGEEIIWDPEFENDTEFWLMPPAAWTTEGRLLTAPEIVMKDTETGRVLEADASGTMNGPGFDEYNTVSCSATVVYRKGEKTVGAEEVSFSEGMFKDTQKDSAKLKFDGKFDSCDIYIQYDQVRFMQEGY